MSRRTVKHRKLLVQMKGDKARLQRNIGVDKAARAIAGPQVGNGNAGSLHDDRKEEK